jgi:20S proteasome alpha/beta subunit
VRVNPRVIGSTAFANLVRTIVLLCCLGSAAALYAQDIPEASHGTVNIALANANGIVLLTDSVQSFHRNDGWHFHQPVQKLFRLDNKTVCSIAGFASETGWIPPELNTDVTGIMADFKDQLTQKPVPELEAKLRGIAYLVSFYIEVVANRYEVAFGSGTPIGAYEFEVIVAGYDVDGKPKVEKLVITPVVSHSKGRSQLLVNHDFES